MNLKKRIVLMNCAMQVTLRAEALLRRRESEAQQKSSQVSVPAVAAQISGLVAPVKTVFTSCASFLC